MSTRLTVVCENSVGGPLGLIGEHGLACHLATTQGNYLFDTGSGLGIITNAKLLGLNLKELRGIIISHGHYDHAGGLKKVLELTGPIDVYAHPGLFTPRFSISETEQREIGVPHRQKELEQLGARFHFDREAVELTPELTITGEIPRLTGFERGDHRLCCTDKDGGLIPDPLADDLSLLIRTDKGLSVLLGCAHAGLINILKHTLNLTGEHELHAVIGGTHLMFCDDRQLQITLEQLDNYQIKKLGAAHCTGLPQAAKLAAHLGERFFFASAGCSLEL
ncbi:MAG TPA: MBL fold metallo-hydrolase [Geopsychrobacteraceae bacterium]|nr:MBL fold metallo-hydrolase [Geopsychrobacteraceae bacterium]